MKNKLQLTNLQSKTDKILYTNKSSYGVIRKNMLITSTT